MGRRRAGQDAEPAEGIDPLELLALVFGDGSAADAMEAIAARDIGAIEAMAGALQRVFHEGRVGGDVADHDILDTMHNRGAYRILGGVKLSCDLGLAENHDALAGQLVEIDVDHQIIVGEVAAVMGHALAVHAL